MARSTFPAHSHLHPVDRMTLSRRAWLGAVGALAATAAWGSASALAQQATPVASPVSAGRDWRQEHWVGSWFAPVHPPFAGAEGMEMFPSQLIPLDAQTLRQIVRVSAGGDRARVRISNLYGVEPLTIGAAHLALRDA